MEDNTGELLGVGEAQKSKSKRCPAAVLVIFIVLAVAGIAGSCVFFVFYWKYSNEATLFKTDLDQALKVIKSVICNGTIDNAIEIKPVLKTLVTNDKSFLVLSNQTIGKLSPIGELKWKHTAEVGQALTQVIAEGAGSTYNAILDLAQGEVLITLQNSGEKPSAITLPEDRNWTTSVFGGEKNDVLLHGITITNYSSYFVKYNQKGELSWSKTTPGFIAYGFAYENSKKDYYLCGQLFENNAHAMAVYKLAEDGTATLLIKNADFETAHGIMMVDKTLMLWHNDAGTISVFAYDLEGKKIKESIIEGFDMIHECQAVPKNNLVCSLEGEKESAIVALGKEMQTVWTISLPGQKPMVLNADAEGAYMAVLNDRIEHAKQKEQTYLSFDGLGRVLSKFHISSADFMIYNMQAQGRSAFYGILGGLTLNGNLVDAPTRALIINSRFNLEDLKKYCPK